MSSVVINWSEQTFANVGTSVYLGLDIFCLPLYEYAFVHQTEVVRKIARGKLLGEWVDFIKKIEDVPYVSRRSTYLGSGAGETIIFEHPEGTLLEIAKTSKDIEIEIYALKECYDKFLWLFNYVEPLGKEQGSLFTLITTSEGLSISRIANGGVDLERDNYSPSVLDGYDYVVKQFSSASPFGRIAIFDGPPGGGKTHLIRGLLSSLTETRFILVPPALIPQLGTPSFVPALLAIRDEEETDGRSITLILEDADDVLAPRMSDNISSISAILNMGDGLFGNAFNIRILATSNSKSEELDAAILRPGRLCRHITVEELDHEQANVVLRRLTGNIDSEMPNKRSHSLAEIYGTAANAHMQTKGKRFGF